MKVNKEIFEKIISLENLFFAWDAFKKDKRDKKDVLRFEWNLEENIFRLHRDLRNRRYHHDFYVSFCINDPKPRHIHKATVRDRILHHAIFNILNPIFEPAFIAHSFSCQIGKGTHKGVNALENFLRQVSRNYTKPCFALKCDIQKFFATVDHDILYNILKKRIKDIDALRLIKEIIESFVSCYSTIFEKKGLPIGNLTSQLFANVYLNEFDQFIKHRLKVKYYVRYTDDFVIVSNDLNYLRKIIMLIRAFLKDKLELNLHSKKVNIRKFYQGIDFLGYVILPHYRLLRTKTKRRIFFKLKHRVKEFRSSKISEETFNQSLQSYLGVLTHANAFKLSEELRNQLWFWLSDH
jgi:retron-type reverse transcriptase